MCWLILKDLVSEIFAECKTHSVRRPNAPFSTTTWSSGLASLCVPAIQVVAEQGPVAAAKIISSPGIGSPEKMRNSLTHLFREIQCHPALRFRNLFDSRFRYGRTQFPAMRGRKMFISPGTDDRRPFDSPSIHQEDGITEMVDRSNPRSPLRTHSKETRGRRTTIPSPKRRQNPSLI